eukprot:GSChrysophyteH1.ASY1.ANO1.2573.1 assembled CDS
MSSEEKWTNLRNDFKRDGYLVIPDLLSRPEIDRLLQEAAEITRGQRGEVQGISESTEALNDKEVLERYVCVHFPHKISDTIKKEYISHPSIVELLSNIIGPDVKCMQSMLFIKGSGKPGQAWHQDEYYIPTRDRSLTAVWMALDDATIENGCLWVRPGSHSDGILYDMAPHNSADFDSGNELVGTPDDKDLGISVPVKAGSAVVFNGYLHHRSLPNRAPPGTFRRALVHHYMSARSLLPWDMDGRIPATRDMRDIVMVCGNDPYAWKGLEDWAKPFLRAVKKEDEKDRKVF